MADLIKEIIEDIKDKKEITVSYIQRNFSVGFLTANAAFAELLSKDYISQNGKVNRKNIYKELGLKPRPEMKLIFLDVDGVLNCSTTKDLCEFYTGIEDKKVAILKQIVDKTDAKIVLISTWRYTWNKENSLKSEQEELATYLDEKLEAQGLSIFDKIDNEAIGRGQGIIEFIDNLKINGFDVEQFVIIDDEMFDYKETKLTKYLIQTGYKEGLTKKHISKAVEKLNTI